MSEYTFRFLISQAAEGVVFTQTNDANPFAPGNLAGWTSPSFKPNDANVLEGLVEDGGQWIGTVQMLPGHVVNMIATYFPVEGKSDNIQLAGPIMNGHAESSIAIVGGGGQFAGARGEARCRVAMSDKDTPIYRYELNFTT